MRRIDLNTKLRLTVDDAAYALSISKANANMLFKKGVLNNVGGKVATKDLYDLINKIYHPDFPLNIENTEHRKCLIEVFCNQKEKINYLKTLQGV